MRACVVGGGLVGSLLAWQLVRHRPRCRVDLVRGTQHRADATTASGGAVRAYETDPEQRRLAVASLAELLASPTLRRWSGFRPVESVYLAGAGTPIDGVAEINQALPGSAELCSADELAARAWADLPAGAVAVYERRAGYLVPGELRDAVQADAAGTGRMRLHPGALEDLALRDGGTIECRFAGERREYDLVVIAAGAWTPALLARHGLPAGGYRTKSIQYAVYRTGDWRPSQFVDELAGWYGRPGGAGELLLGVPTDQWGVDPDRPPVTPALHRRAVRLARTRFPKLQLGPAVRTVGAADCYGTTPILSLRPVVGIDHQLFTFTGGAGGCIKTALAASREATNILADNPTPLPLGPQGGQP